VKFASLPYTAVIECDATESRAVVNVAWPGAVEDSRAERGNAVEECDGARRRPGAGGGGDNGRGKRYALAGDRWIDGRG